MKKVTIKFNIHELSFTGSIVDDIFNEVNLEDRQLLNANNANIAISKEHNKQGHKFIKKVNKLLKEHNIEIRGVRTYEHHSYTEIAATFLGRDIEFNTADSIKQSAEDRHIYGGNTVYATTPSMKCSTFLGGRRATTPEEFIQVYKDDIKKAMRANAAAKEHIANGNYEVDASEYEDGRKILRVVSISINGVRHAKFFFKRHTEEISSCYLDWHLSKELYIDIAKAAL